MFPSDSFSPQFPPSSIFFSVWTATVMEMLNNYKALSEHIKVETVDPILHPNFRLEYTTENVSSGSLLVVSEKRYKLIQASDLYTTSMNYNTYTIFPLVINLDSSSLISPSLCPSNV